MGFITVAGTLSFLFTGFHRHSFFRPTGCSSLCLEASRERSNNNEQQQPVSPFNRTVAKYGLEKAMEIYRENGRKGNTAFGKKYGTIFNATVEKHGLEKALEICSEGGRKANKSFKEKYGSVFNATAQKYGLQKAKEIYSDNSSKGRNAIKEKYGSPTNATVAKYGLEGASEIFRESRVKAYEAKCEKYTIEEIQQMASTFGVESARKNGKYTRYPGVYRTGTGKWRVQFSYKGKVRRAGSAHTTEYEAALAHDEYVRNLGLKRPLHFPREGERTSYVDDEPTCDQ